MPLTASFCAQSANADPVLDTDVWSCCALQYIVIVAKGRDDEVASTGFSNFTLGTEPHSR